MRPFEQSDVQDAVILEQWQLIAIYLRALGKIATYAHNATPFSYLDECGKIARAAIDGKEFQTDEGDD